jgi:hypothetical protein
MTSGLNIFYIFHWAGQSIGDKQALEHCPLRTLKQNEFLMVFLGRVLFLFSYFPWENNVK